MPDSWVYLTATVVGVCAVVLIVTLSIIICWVVVYCKHAKVRARKGQKDNTKWKDPSTLSTVSVETKPRHAHTYHGQSFRPTETMDASGVYIYGVSGTLSGTSGMKFHNSKNGTIRSNYSVEWASSKE